MELVLVWFDTCLLVLVALRILRGSPARGIGLYWRIDTCFPGGSKPGFAQNESWSGLS